MTEPAAAQPEPDRPVIRDKRRVKATGGGPQQAPGTGQPASAQPEGPTPASGGEGGAPGAAPEQPDTAPPPAAETGRPGVPEAPAAGDAQPPPPRPPAVSRQQPPDQARQASAPSWRRCARRWTERDLQRSPQVRQLPQAGGAGPGASGAGHRQRADALLPVLDDIDRAGTRELVDGFAAVAEQLISALTKFRLTAFGEGRPVRPEPPRAVAPHLRRGQRPTCIDILRRGYLLGDRLLQPAMVRSPIRPATS